jgi:hypothetical protein
VLESAEFRATLIGSQRQVAQAEEG